MHSSPGGPGIPVAKIPEHRVRLDKRQLDHFLEFTSLPYYYQDVAFGGRNLKLESEELVMPNIVRTISAKKKISVLRVAPLCGGFLKFRKPPKENPLKVLITRQKMTSMVLKHFTRFYTN